MKRELDLAWETNLDPGHQSAVASMAPAGGLTQSSGSGIFFQRDGQSQSVVNSHLRSSFGNSSISVLGSERSSAGLVSGDMNNAAMNSVGNSGPSVGASSLVTDANSSFSGGPHLQRSASFNADSYLRVPASPLSFSSNNISFSGSSVIDGSSVVQQSSHQDQSSQQMLKSQQQQKQGASSVTSLPAAQTNQVSLPMGGSQMPGYFMQGSINQSHLHKKPRLDIKQEDMRQQQVLQLLQRSNSMQLQGCNPQLQALLQQQRLQEQQQKLLQPQAQLLRGHLQQQQQLLLRQEQGTQSNPAMKRPFDDGVCSRRLLQFLYHQRQRPPDNNIAYWRKFVAEYYSPRARKRWCLSSCENIGQHALGVFPQASMVSWECSLCHAKSGRGFEAFSEALPRLNEVKFGSGVVDELLILNLPREYRYTSGMLVLEDGKAVQETVYEQLRVVREGKLRIIFTPDLKILSWEFCGRRYEEFLSRRVVAPQVNQLLQVAQKCQRTISDSKSDGISKLDLEAHSNLVLATGRHLAKSLESQAVNDLGLSKRYVRCLQIAEVVNSMKDLMDFCKEKRVGPIDGLKCFPLCTNSSRHQMREIEKLANIQGLPTDQKTLSTLMALQNGLSNQTNSSHPMVGRGILSSSGQAALALRNYENNPMKQNSFNSSPNSLQKELSPSSGNANQSPPSFQGPAAVPCGSMSNLPVSGFPGSCLPPQPQSQQMQHCHSTLQQNLQSSQGNHVVQQQMMQQPLREMPNNNKGSNPYVLQQQCLRGQNLNGSGFTSNHSYRLQHQSLGGHNPNGLGSVSNHSYGFQQQSLGAHNLGSMSNHAYGLQQKSLGGQNPNGSVSACNTSYGLQQQSLGGQNPNELGSASNNSYGLQQKCVGEQNPNGSSSASNHSLQSLGGQNPNGSSSASNHSLQSLAGQNPNGLSSGSKHSAAVPSTHVSGTVGPAPRSNSFKGGSSSESTGAGSSNGLSEKAPDMPESQSLQDDLAQNIDYNDFINSCLNDEMIYEWQE